MRSGLSKCKFMITIFRLLSISLLQESYEKFNGFIVLHGTDTMAYTASALSFMLENLGKSVVITGSQVNLFYVFQYLVKAMVVYLFIFKERYKKFSGKQKYFQLKG